MTKERLRQLYFLTKEIELKRQQLEKLNNFAAGGVAVLTVGSKGKQNTDTVGNTASRMADLKKELEDALFLYWQEFLAVHGYIKAIPSGEIRYIFQLRYINGLSWQQIANRIGVLDESSPRKKHDRWLKREFAKEDANDCA
ncbi:MAG: hypothetical protein PHN47_06235 [Clostridia bacterium]|jgi:hypothetical protein|nr:hypothetical protein [Clostridia bacterium]MDD4572063.1 hypothetical protein [Clostridia bacterium]